MTCPYHQTFYYNMSQQYLFLMSMLIFYKIFKTYRKIDIILYKALKENMWSGIINYKLYYLTLFTRDLPFPIYLILLTSSQIIFLSKYYNKLYYLHYYTPWDKIRA